MLTEWLSAIHPMMPKAIVLLLSLAAAALLGVIFDEWLQIRAIEKDIKKRKKHVQDMISAYNDPVRHASVRNEVQRLLAEQKKEQARGLRKLLPLSGCLWHSNG